MKEPVPVLFKCDYCGLVVESVVEFRRVEGRWLVTYARCPNCRRLQPIGYELLREVERRAEA